MPENISPEFRYFTYCVDYYRRLLKSELKGEPVPTKPEFLEGLEIIAYDKGNFNISNKTQRMKNNQRKKKKKAFSGKSAPSLKKQEGK